MPRAGLRGVYSAFLRIGCHVFDIIGLAGDGELQHVPHMALAMQHSRFDFRCHSKLAHRVGHRHLQYRVNQ